MLIVEVRVDGKSEMFKTLEEIVEFWNQTFETNFILEDGDYENE